MSGLRSIAEADLEFILEDPAGFGWPLTVTDPCGNSQEFTGFSSDISQVIDPDTGQAVAGRLASVCLRLSSLAAKSMGPPTAVADEDRNPWTIQFQDINLRKWLFRVKSSVPDRALGTVNCYLELYKEC